MSSVEQNCEGGELYSGKEISGEFVVACGDASEVLEAAEAAFDDIAALVGLLVVADALFTIGLSGDDRLAPFPQLAQRWIFTWLESSVGGLLAAGSTAFSELRVSHR